MNAFIVFNQIYYILETVIVFGILLPQSVVTLYLVGKHGRWSKKSLMHIFGHSIFITLTSGLVIHLFVSTKFLLDPLIYNKPIYGVGAMFQTIIYILIPFIPLAISRAYDKRASWTFHLGTAYIWFLLIALFMLFNLRFEFKTVIQSYPLGIFNLIAPIRIFDFLTL